MLVKAKIKRTKTREAGISQKLKGKKQVFIRANDKPLARWNILTVVLARADYLQVPHRSLTDILAQLNAFRESE